MMKQYDQSNLGRNGIIQLLFLHYSLSSSDVNTGTQTGQEPKQKPWRGDAYWLGLLGRLSYKTQDNQSRDGTIHNELDPFP